MKNRLQQLQEKIIVIANQYHRDVDDISLLAVSKNKTVAEMLELYDQGQRAFGENYLQDAIEKISVISHQDISWHFIGRIQSNKIKLITKYFDWVQTVASETVAEKLNKYRVGVPLNICIQVNVGEEVQKSGVMLSEVLPLANAIAKLPNLCLRGLMAMGVATDDFEQQCFQFRKMKQCFDELKKHHASVDTLSLGMSGDMEAAIREGSSMLRIGRAL